MAPLDDHQPDVLNVHFAELPRVALRWRMGRLALVGLAAAGILLEHGFYQPPLEAWLIHLTQAVLLITFAIDVVLRAWRRHGAWGVLTHGWVDLALLGVAGLGAMQHLTTGGAPGWNLVKVAAGALFFTELWRVNVNLAHRLARPGLLLPISFLFLIAVGTLLIKLPVAVPAGESLRWIDALFTMTSAVCVTGLSVRNTAADFTPFGQALIGIFIQLGGLGIIIFGSVLAMLLGRALSLKENVTLSEMIQEQPMQNLTGFVRFIVIGTLAIEFIGAVLLYPLWDAPAGETLTQGQRIGMSLFHAVSAFCNAGFDITGSSLEPYRYSALSHMVIFPLVFLGAVGFPVFENVRQMVRYRIKDWLQPPDPQHAEEWPINLRHRRVSLHTKVVLVAMLSVYLVGAVGLFADQLVPHFYAPTHADEVAWLERPEPITLDSLGRNLADASFMSMAARTSGFSSMPMDEIGPAGQFTLITMMVIGGSPGGTAGGMKTTVVALLLLSVIATLRNREETEAFGRQINDSLVRKAATLASCYLVLVVVSTLVLLLSEGAPFQVVMFEAVSAATTTGMSLGLTSELTDFGKTVIIVTMYLGRIGPLTLLGALLFARTARRAYGYAHEEVVLG